MNRNQYKLILETISPLHIGNGEMLSSVGEFITTSDNIRYLRLDELDKFLAAKDLIDSYTNSILERGEEFDTFTTLQNFGIEIEKFILKDVKLNAKDLKPTDNNILYIFNNNNGNTYIPGSSIKGMLKTILLFHYLKNDVGYIKDIEKTINTKFEGWNKYDAIKWLNNKWENEVTNIFNSKEFNLLRPSDTPYYEKSNIHIEQVKRQNIYDSGPTSLDWLQEVIIKGATNIFNLTIVPNFGGKFSFLNSPNLYHLFEYINDYSLSMINFELDLLNDSSYENKNFIIEVLEQLKDQIDTSNNEFAICRIGKGKSIYFQTILSLLKEEALKIYINKIKGPDNSNGNYPSTRVLTAFDEMLGWVKLYEPTPEICNNEVTEIIEKETTIKANFVDSKTVSFKINGQLYQAVQLVNPLKKEFNKFHEISVIIWQLSSKGINQVKLL